MMIGWGFNRPGNQWCGGGTMLRLGSEVTRGETVSVQGEIGVMLMEGR